MWFSETFSIWFLIITILILAVMMSLQTSIVTRSAEKGRWKQTIFTMQKALIFLGILLLVVGIVAKTVHQTFSVWAPLCIPGFLYLTVMLLQLIITKNLYSSYQRKKTQAEAKAAKQNSSLSVPDSNTPADSLKGIYNHISKDDEK